MSLPEGDFAAWIAKAENDLLNIQNNLASTRVPWDTVCFHAQQVAEKYLKAYLVYRGKRVSKTHDLVALLTLACEIDAELETLENYCRRLTYYAIGVRYPDELYEPTEQDAREMLEAMEKVRNRIAVKLS